MRLALAVLLMAGVAGAVAGFVPAVARRGVPGAVLAGDGFGAGGAGSSWSSSGSTCTPCTTCRVGAGRSATVIDPSASGCSATGTSCTAHTARRTPASTRLSAGSWPTGWIVT